MIEFKSIEIENFSSIEHLYYEFKNSVVNLLGKNGSGKTSILVALLQGLYNKNVKQEKDNIEETYNKITNKPYKITIVFKKDDDKYIVVNDRSRNKIDIYKNDENISVKGIKNQLKQIENILGIDYRLFSSFYYLSVNTLHSVFDISNEQNLVYRFFDTETLLYIEKQLKKKEKEYKNESRMIIAAIQSIDKQISTLLSFKKIDKEALLLKKNSLLETLAQATNPKITQKIEKLNDTKNRLQNNLSEVKVQKREKEATKRLLEKQKKEFETGICPVCQQSVKDKENYLQKEIEMIDKQLNEIETNEKEILNQIDRIESIIEDMNEKYLKKKKEIEKEIHKIDVQLMIYQEQEDQYNQLANNLEELEKEKETLAKRYEEFKEYLLFINVALNIIKSKVIMKQYLQNFVKLLNIKLQDISDKIGFENNIVVFEEKGKLDFKFIYNDVEKTLFSLSSGEKTRASLIVLFAMLETLQMLSNVKINVLAIDEIMGVLDKEGVNLLKRLLEYYKKDLNIFVIQHHEEVEKEFFDYSYQVFKANGLTQMKEI